VPEEQPAHTRGQQPGRDDSGFGASGTVVLIAINVIVY